MTALNSFRILVAGKIEVSAIRMHYRDSWAL
jgi:hypothetical protein